MKFLKTSLVLISAMSVTFAASSSRQLSRLLGGNVQTVDMRNGTGVCVTTLKGEEENNTQILTSLMETFNPGASTAICPFSSQDVQSINRILTDAIAYLYGLIDTNNNDPDTISHKTDNLKDQFKGILLVPSYILFNIKAENTAIEMFLNNLLFLQNTVTHNLDQSDEKIRDKAYQQIVKEIDGIQKWFQTGFSVEMLHETNTFLWLETLSVIFSDLQKYFPSKNVSPFARMFQLTNGHTRIDQMDTVITHFMPSIEKTRKLYEKRSKRKGTTPQQMEAYFKSTLSQPLAIAHMQLQTAIKPLLLPFIMNDDIRQKMKEAPRVSGLRRRVSPARSATVLPTKSAVTSSASQRVVELDDDFVEEFQTQPAAMVVEPSSAMAAEAAASAQSAHEENDDGRQKEDDQEEVLSPQQIHAMHQVRKKEEKRTSPQPEDEIAHNPEFYAFLRDTVYGKPQFTWEHFAREANRAGFEIMGAGGNVRRVALKGTNLKFTVHEPAEIRDPMAYKYVSFIRSGLTNVFGLSKEFVSTFQK